MTAPLLEVRDLVKHFTRGGGFLAGDPETVHALNGVSFDIARGETVGLVGESGCGKSTLGKAIVRMHEPSAGSVRFDGQDLAQLAGPALRPYRRRIQFIFQDPYSALNPRLTVRGVLREPVRLHGVVSRAEEEAYLQELAAMVGLRADSLDRYPHEFSGGQRQRIVIARALSVKPELVIADEPTSALDVSVQAQIINLLLDLKSRFGLTLLFVTHNLKLVENFCDRVIVLYLGRIVEVLPAEGLAAQAKHPYTRSLLDAIPIDDPDERRERPLLTGQPPSALDLPVGCAFAGRCPMATPRCKQERPELREIDGAQVACHEV